nr:transferrin-binding protein-like solute binding protein [Sphingomicrobium sediminis]
MAIYADPYFSNFNYQTFGVWATGLGTGSGNLGALSVGAATDGTRIPPTGSVVFTGYVAGILTQDGENAAEVVADASFSTNFENRTIEVEAVNSQLSNAVGSLTPNDAALLDFTGTLTYGGGGNTITGIFSTSPTLNLSGEASGQFFGPDANEIGGTFFLTNPDDSMSYIGGFGGN